MYIYIYDVYDNRNTIKHNKSLSHTLKTPGYFIATPPSKIDPAKCRLEDYVSQRDVCVSWGIVYVVHVYRNHFPNFIVFCKHKCHQLDDVL